MKQDNLNTYYQNEQQKFSIAALRKTFNSMVDAQIWQHKLNAISSENIFDEENVKRANYNNPFIGNFLSGGVSLYKVLGSGPSFNFKGRTTHHHFDNSNRRTQINNY